MDIVYLDQNKWIELARVRSGALGSGPISDLYAQLSGAVLDGRALFPLSASHVLETSKRNDLTSRTHLAETQALLSRGYAYRSRASRLRVEIRATLHRIFGLEPPELPPHWAIAHGFLQAFEPMDELVGAPEEVARMRRMHSFVDPADLYVDFMTRQDDDLRRVAHQKLSSSLEDLISRIEQRRTKLQGEPIDLRRRAYSVQLFIDHQDLFNEMLVGIGHTFEELKALGDSAVKALIEDVPTLNVEAEMSARLESKTGPLAPNDVFDIQSFYTAIPYSTHVVAEKGSISRAQQAKLDSRYGVTLSRSLESLLNLYPSR